MKPLTRNQATGTRRQGSMFMVLNCLMFKMERPELAMRKPPMMEISVSSSWDKNGARNPAPR